ncbi:MAG: hypothetical protein N2253_09100 [Bacteroidia bacterium]|nr:hypothetical protein [Bacteroidia bacterium]
MELNMYFSEINSGLCSAPKTSSLSPSSLPNGRLNFGFLALSKAIYQTRYTLFHSKNARLANKYHTFLRYLSNLSESFFIFHSLNKVIKDPHFSPNDYMIDFEANGFWGRVGAAVGYLAMIRGGYVYLGHFNCKKKRGKGGSVPDFLVEAPSTKEVGILETKCTHKGKETLTTQDRVNICRQICRNIGILCESEGRTTRYGWYVKTIFKGGSTGKIELAHTPGAFWKPSGKSLTMGLRGRFHFGITFHILGIGGLGYAFLSPLSKVDVKTVYEYLREVEIVILRHGGHEYIMSEDVSWFRFRHTPPLFYSLYPWRYLVPPFLLLPPDSTDELIPLFALRAEVFDNLLRYANRFILRGGAETEPYEDESFFLWDIPDTLISVSERQKQPTDISTLQVEESPVLFPDGTLAFSLAMLRNGKVDMVGSQNLYERMKSL